jgi:hypothetical protein
VAVLEVVGAEQRKTRRSPALGGRWRTVRVSLSAEEWALVEAGAEREGMAMAAWMGVVGVRAAVPQADAPVDLGGQMVKLGLVHDGLVDLRRILRNVGGNLNDIARHANTTGAIAPETSAVEELVARVVQHVDVNLDELRGVLAVTRRSQRVVLDAERRRRL